MNVCTFSYSTVWWDWERWERELDWMALNGINTPLAIGGQEFVWREIFTKRFNMTRDDLDEFFTGPAFLAWRRMGNLRKWAGPLSDAWMNQQRDLQKQIIDRARSLGMKVVLPAFAGHVPEAAKRIWPKADIRQSSSWGAFEEQYTSVYMVQPDSPVFAEIGAAFIQELIHQFGTDHLYNADTFNEVVTLNFFSLINCSLDQTKIARSSIPGTNSCINCTIH
jgi:alpha-N-acetylglucosaminidase